MEIKKGSVVWQILLLIVIVLFTTKSVLITVSWITYVKLFTFLAVWYLMVIGIGTMYTGKKKSNPMLMILHSLNIGAFMALVGVKASAESLVFLLASLNGLLTSAFGVLKSKRNYEESVKDLEFFHPEAKAEIKTEPYVVSVKKDFGPGKYIASNNGEKYHSPKCDWAKKINKKRIVWLQDEADAQAKGYLPCDCVK